MIRVDYNNETDCPYPRSRVGALVKLAARFETRLKGSVIITTVSEVTMKRLNFRYRHRHVATDVLSFAWADEPTVSMDDLGELYLCYPYIARQAKRFHKTAAEEFARTLVHGLLHIVGHDHIKKREATRMFAIQEKIVAKYFIYAS